MEKRLLILFCDDPFLIQHQHIDARLITHQM